MRVNLANRSKPLFLATFDSGKFHGIEATRVWLRFRINVLVGGCNEENVEICSTKTAAGCF